MNEEEGKNKKSASDTLKAVGKVVKKIGKRVMKMGVVFVLIFVFIAALFWGVIDEAFDKLSEIGTSLKDSVTIENNNIVIPDDFKEEIMKRLELAGLSAGELNLGGDLEYLVNWMEAEIVTSYPYMGGTGLQGVITVKRGNTDGTETDLKYTDKDTMNAMIASQDANAKNYFTIDGDNMIVAKTTYNSDGSVNVSSNSFNYMVMVSPYSTPFEFFVALCLITQSPNFVNALANYTKSTTIEITLLESLTTMTTTTQMKGMQTTYTKKEENGVLVPGSETQVGPIEYAEDPVTNVSYVTSLTPIITEARSLFIEKVVEPTYTDRTDNPEPQVYTKDVLPEDCADIIGDWIEIDRQTVTPPATTTTTTTTSSTTSSSTTTSSSVIVTYQKIDKTDITKTVTTSTRYQSWQAGTTTTKDNTDDFLHFIVTDTGELPGGISTTVAEEDMANQEIDLSQIEGYPRTILEAAKACKSYVANNGFTYGPTGSIPVTQGRKTVDCSGFVSWVMYEAGYKASFVGGQHTVSTIRTNPWGWQVIDNFNDMQPGDIVIMRGYDNGKLVDYGHTQIYAGNGLYYNCGSTSAIKVDGPTRATRTQRDFHFALRPSEPSEGEQNGTESSATSGITMPGMMDPNVTIEGIYILYDVPGSSAPLSPKESLVTGAEMLFELLGSAERTQIYETVMRYILYRLTGHDYGVTSLDLSIFGSDSFSSSSSMGLANYLRQFSHSGEAPQSSDGKFYLMYGDGKGWPTIGNADLQWASHYTKFDVPGLVLENGVEIQVDSIKDYVGSKLPNGHGAEYSNETINSLQIYIEKEAVDKVGEQVRNSCLQAVKSQVPDTLSKQQLWALTAIFYNFGHLPERGGKEFADVYNEATAQFEINSWQHNRYVWDNWWCKIGGGASGHIPARDAAFETYVKGVYDFSGSAAGEVFNRTHYIYYTAAQLAQFSYAPSKQITRTSANEEEIFTYVERAGGEVGSMDFEGYQYRTYTSSNGKTYTWWLQNYGPYINQRSPKFGDTFSNSGCYCTAVSTIASGYGKTTPPSWQRGINEFQMSSNYLYSGCPSGSVSSQLGQNHVTAIKNHLMSGGEVIVHVQGPNRGGNSRYTRGQHWMPIVDISEDGTQIYNMNTTSGSLNNGQSEWLDFNDVFTAVNCYHLISGIK